MSDFNTVSIRSFYVDLSCNVMGISVLRQLATDASEIQAGRDFGERIGVGSNLMARLLDVEKNCIDLNVTSQKDEDFLEKLKTARVKPNIQFIVPIRSFRPCKEYLKSGIARIHEQQSASIKKADEFRLLFEHKIHLYISILGSSAVYLSYCPSETDAIVNGYSYLTKYLLHALVNTATLVNRHKENLDLEECAIAQITASCSTYLSMMKDSKELDPQILKKPTTDEERMNVDFTNTIPSFIACYQKSAANRMLNITMIPFFAEIAQQRECYKIPKAVFYCSELGVERKEFMPLSALRDKLHVSVPSFWQSAIKTLNEEEMITVLSADHETVYTGKLLSSLILKVAKKEDCPELKKMSEFASDNSKDFMLEVKKFEYLVNTKDEPWFIRGTKFSV